MKTAAWMCRTINRFLFILLNIITLILQRRLFLLVVIVVCVVVVVINVALMVVLTLMPIFVGIGRQFDILLSIFRCEFLVYRVSQLLVLVFMVSLHLVAMIIALD